MIFLNFKIYPETSGENTLKLCRLIKDKRVIPCLQAVDIVRVKQVLPDLEIWGQYADPVGLAAANGVLLNHCEHQLNFDQIKATVVKCRESKLRVMIITDSLELIKQVNEFKPDYIGFEDPQLIGGPVAMIDAHFDLVQQAAAAAGAVPLIVGGGIRTTEHVKKSLQAGGQGVLVASELAKSPNPAATLADLLLGLDS